MFIHGYETVWELEKGLEEYLNFYNHRRPHQHLAYKRPADLYVKKHEEVGVPAATYLSGFHLAPQDIFKRFEGEDIWDMKKEESLSLPLFKPLRPSAPREGIGSRINRRFQREIMM